MRFGLGLLGGWLTLSAMGALAPRPAAAFGRELPQQAAESGKELSQQAVESESELSEAELDQLTAEVGAQLRCLVCRSQSVAESPTELAREMQELIRERLAAGESPDEVKAYFVSRYGEVILLRPEPRGVNLLVYLIPALLVLGGALLVGRNLRRWSGGGARSVRKLADRTAEGDEAEEESLSETGETAEESLSEADEAWLEEAIRNG